MHKKKYLHRDIKTENILLDEFDKIKISDFGFSTKLGPEGVRKSSLGTPDYMSPELNDG